MIYLIDNFSQSEKYDFGGKANNLIFLANNNIEIPEFRIIPFSTLSELIADETGKMDALVEECFAFYQSCVAKGFKHIALRSSANIEDNAMFSFAGQFESFLNLDSKSAIGVGILNCFENLKSERILAYCNKNNIEVEKIELSLIVQAQIEPVFSGVMFTTDPMRGNDQELIIEYTTGLADKLVQGELVPGRVHYNWYRNDLMSHSFLSETVHMEMEQIADLAKIGVEIMSLYGNPQDIEWTYVEGAFQIVQSRPITSIKFRIDGEWTNADLKDGGISSTITTPFMYSLYNLIFSKTMDEYFKKLHILAKENKEPWFSSFYGFSYWNMKKAKEGTKRIPGWKERQFDESLGIQPDYEGDGHVTKFNLKSLFDGIRVLLATKKSIKERQKVCEKTIYDIQSFFNKVNMSGYAKMSNDDFMPLLNELMQQYIYMESNYFFTVYDNSNATTFYNEALDKIKKKQPDINELLLTAGLQNVSHLRPLVSLWKLSRQILANETAKNYYMKNEVVDLVYGIMNNLEFPLKDEMVRFVIIYKHHSLKELDILIPHWDEDPTQVFETLKEFLLKPDSENPELKNAIQHEKYLNELSKVNSNSFKKALDTHRNLLWWREEMRDNSTQMYYCIRRLFLDYGKRLQKLGVVRKPEEVFFMDYRYAMNAIKNPYRNNYLARIDRNKLFRACYRNFNRPNEIWNKESKPIVVDKNAKRFQGLGCSSGSVEGVVCVLKDINDAGKLQEGQILITKFTDPAWTPIFSKIAGLATETGGMLSHAAVVSREYGIPSVLAVPGITEVLKDGQRIHINGNTGEIIILS